jgi:hypothetical protein
MAETITLYKVFVASPADLKEERILLEEIIDELNLSSFSNSGIKIELIKWETHVNPGIGEYPQGVINSDINQDYDIFIGLLWSKFGSPTKDYGSGTEEEFELAYKKYKKNPSDLKVMFYFKNASIPFDQIDTDSINSIRKFKSSLGEKGVLYWDYSANEEFPKLLRIQLTRKVQELHQVTSNKTTILKENEENIEEELGLLDYLDEGEECFQDIEDILLRMTDSIEWIGKRFTERTDEINKQTALNPEMGNKTKRRLINAAAEDMHSFNARLKTEIPLFSETYKRGIDSFSNAIKISLDLEADKEEDIDETIDSLDTFISAIEESNQVCEEFRDSMNNFPRMTKEFNAAKRLSTKNLTDLINEFDIAINLAKALRIEFEEYKSKY